MADGSFATLDPLRDIATHLKRTGGTLHLMGLLGFGGVHALDQHLLGVLEWAAAAGIRRVAIQGFLDGRDSPPTSGERVVARLVDDLRSIAGDRAMLATLTGRYYAMDRDQRWERTRLAYEALVHGAGHPVTNPVQGVREAYDRGETDEFIRPLVIQRDGAPVAPLRDGDAVLCFNFRSDRMRQIVRALMVDGFDGFEVPDRPQLAMATMTRYDQRFDLPILFPPFSLSRIMAEVLADSGRSQLRTAETEKYPHVTYFFNGGHETPCRGEERVLVPSPRVATYDLAPEMSAAGVTDRLCEGIERRAHDFILCNYANADMVGHTGVPAAIIRAVETVDQCLARVLKSAERANAAVLITADHGNCEVMVDPETGGPHTAHTTNPVPLVGVNIGAEALRSGGSLRDVGPTVLRLLGIDPPPEMTGRDLRDLQDS
jgi:2,3-bisphosphoglycerate-independent phosphoglycerate mutase